MRIRLYSASDRKIHAIKALRSVTGLGLREAKEVYDAVRDGTYHVITVGETIDHLNTTWVVDRLNEDFTFDILAECEPLPQKENKQDIILQFLEGLPYHTDNLKVSELRELFNYWHNID